jgi:hypothetical protein
VYFAGLALGLSAGGMTFWKFYKRIVMKGVKKPDADKPERISFSKHV